MKPIRLEDIPQTQPAFGVFIREMRAAAGLSSMEATRRLGWKSPSILSDLEGGRWYMPHGTKLLDLLILYTDRGQIVSGLLPSTQETSHAGAQPLDPPGR